MSETRKKLVEAALAEFTDHGFAGTDTNRIARRAGFAPQTFYRWFKDKSEIFLAAYEAWQAAERDLMASLLKQKASLEDQVEAAIVHHREHRLFRRSLRRLGQEDPAVREARAKSRLSQIGRLGGADPGAAAVALIQMERLAEALAEGELGDMGLDEEAARQTMTELLGQLRQGGRSRSSP